MRYRDINTVKFEDPDRGPVRVKDMREVPLSRTAFRVPRMESEAFDRVAVRGDVFGASAESRAYELHDANAVAIVDYRFDYSRISEVKVPE